MLKTLVLVRIATVVSGAGYVLLSKAIRTVGCVDRHRHHPSRHQPHQDAPA